MREGLWQSQAYEDALKRAWARSHAFDARGLHTEPYEFSLDHVIGTVEMRMQLKEEVLSPGELLTAPIPDDFIPAPAPEADQPAAKPETNTIERR